MLWRAHANLRLARRLVTDRLPALSPRDMVRTLERAGLRVVREGRSHTVMWREGLPRPVPVPRHVRELKRSLMLAIIKEAGLTVGEFVEHLRR